MLLGGRGTGHKTMELGVGGWGEVDKREQAPLRYVTVGEGRGGTLGSFTLKHPPACKKGAVSGRPGWGQAAGQQDPSGARYPALSLGCALGQSCRTQVCSCRSPQACKAFPAPGSAAAAKRAEGSRGLHGNVDVMAQRPGTQPPAPTRRPGASPAAICRSWDGRGVGAATLPSDLSRPGHHRQTGVSQARQVSPACPLPPAPLPSNCSQLAAG